MAIKSWIIRNEDLYGKTDQEKLRKLMEEVDSQIKIRYRFDQQRVRESDKSFFLLPMEVRTKRHTLQQKRLWVETVDLAFNAWNNDQSRTMPNVAGASVLHRYGLVGMEDIQGFVRNQYDDEAVSTLARVQFLALVMYFKI